MLDSPRLPDSPDMASLRRAILLNPADDAARWAFADACEEAGRLGRASVVREQMRLACQGPDPVHAAWLAGSCADCGLPDGSPGWSWLHNNVWLAELPSSLEGYRVRAGGDVHVVWRRGFVDELRLGVREYAETRAEVFATHPVRWVSLTDMLVRNEGAGEYMLVNGIPHGAYERAKTFRPIADASGWPRPFASAEECLDWWSAELVRQGRRAAGLEGG